MNFQNIYSQMIAELNSKDNVSINTNDFFLRDELLPGFLESHHYLQSETTSVKLLNDNSFTWSVHLPKTKQQFPMGEFHFISIEQLMKQPVQLKDQNAVLKNGLIEKFYPFDDHPFAGDGVMGCFSVIDEELQLWLHTENGELLKLKLNLQEYLHKTFQFKAIYCWQYLFTEVSFNNPVYAVVRSDLNNRLKILHSLFPELQYNNYFIK